MLFWIFVIIAVLGAALYFAAKYWDKQTNWGRSSNSNPISKWLYYNSEGLLTTSLVIFWLATVAVIVSLICMIFVYGGAAGDIAINEARYEALTYKMESTTCRDEFGFLSKEVIDEVQNWNEYLSKNKAMQRNFWVGIYLPNIYDDFEFIDYHSYVSGAD
jgi:hypothetical protein